MSAPAVSQAGDVPDEDFIRAKVVPVRASRRWSGDPLPSRRLYQLAQHVSELRTVADNRLTG
jgi:hypothetical protein